MRQGVLPETVVVVDTDVYHDDRFPEEAALVSRAVAKQRREFATGRWCARRAPVRSEEAFTSTTGRLRRFRRSQ